MADDTEVPEAVECRNFAMFRVDFIVETGAAHAFACQDDLKEIVMRIITGARGRAVRISMTSSDSSEPCEKGVE